MAALSFLWFLTGVFVIPFTAIFTSVRKAFMLAAVWSLPFVAPHIWHDVNQDVATIYNGIGARPGTQRAEL
ncbi:hypothetical protein PP1Y_Spl172 (plasmid) [Novosphingobium sp. PP1Y]|nr:hypothetical protein PP1Y_Spl172 [Novosphingobium sp. PP1Y]